jgi:hypothetical protein
LPDLLPQKTAIAFIFIGYNLLLHKDTKFFPIFIKYFVSLKVESIQRTLTIKIILCRHLFYCLL